MAVGKPEKQGKPGTGPGTGLSSRSGTAPPKAHQFPPGVSGNPGGVLKGSHSLRRAIKRELAKRPDAEGIGEKASDIAKEVVRRLTNGEDFTDSLFGITISQVDGKPDQTVSAEVHILYEAPERLEVPRDVRPSGNGRRRKAQA